MQTGQHAMVQQITAMGSLRVHPENPRYFDDGSGRPVYLTGAHTWSNLIMLESAPSCMINSWFGWMR
jgi:hypothetical protein